MNSDNICRDFFTFAAVICPTATENSTLLSSPPRTNIPSTLKFPVQSSPEITPESEKEGYTNKEADCCVDTEERIAEITNMDSADNSDETDQGRPEVGSPEIPVSPIAKRDRVEKILME